MLTRTGIFTSELRTEIEINAAAERVWKILTDFHAYPGWNPFVTRISGETREGAQLEVTLEPPGGSAMSFRLTVLAAEPGRELRWRGRLLVPGLFDGEHYFIIEPLDARRVRFVQGENFSGALVPFLSGVLSRTGVGFAAMNEALKRRAEASSSS